MKSATKQSNQTAFCQVSEASISMNGKQLRFNEEAAPATELQRAGSGLGAAPKRGSQVLGIS